MNEEKKSYLRNYLWFSSWIGILQTDKRRNDVFFLCFYCLRALFGGLFDDHETIYGPRMFDQSHWPHSAPNGAIRNPNWDVPNKFRMAWSGLHHFALCNCAWPFTLRFRYLLIIPNVPFVWNKFVISESFFFLHWPQECFELPSMHRN